MGRLDCVPSSSTGGTGGSKGDTDGTGGLGGALNGGAEGEYAFCAPASTCPPDVAGVDLITPASFRTDIYSAFLQEGCGGGSLCHGDKLATGYAFGTTENPLTDAEITVLIEQFKYEMSPVANIPNVAPGNWEMSYLMMKLDGCQNEMGLNCNSDAPGLSAAACVQECPNLICPPLPCGDGMPAALPDNANVNAAYPLTDAQRHTVRAWIAQGALDN